MDLFDILRLIGHVTASLVLALIALTAFRWIHRQSRTAALVVALGVLARVSVGAALFVISYFELPVARGLQAGGGFWQFAVDSTRYYDEAMTALRQGVWATDYAGFLSPMYVRVLALFMALVGASPIAGVMLNALIYFAVCALLVRGFRPSGEWRHDLPLVAALVAYSAWPAMFVHSTQPLKDDLFYALIAVSGLGILVVLRLLVYGRRAAGGWVAVALASVAVMAALSGLTDIRWYFPMIVLGALGLVLAIFLVRGRSTRLMPYLGGSAAALVTFWLAAGGLTNPASQFMFPAGTNPFASVRTLSDVPVALGSLARYARAGFLMSGGDTNIVVPVRAESLSNGAARPETLATATPRPRDARPPAPRTHGPPLSSSELAAVRATPRTPVEHAKAAVMGLAVVFVPISLLRATGLVTFSGGRGILPIADLDSVFQGVMVAILLGLLWRRRQLVGQRRPFVVFCITLSGATAILLGYVVTNYGTLFRMRPMIAMPLILAMLALSARGSGAAAAAARGPRV